MSSPQIKLCAIVRIREKLILSTESLNNPQEKSYSSQIPNVLKTIEDVGLKPDERQKVKSSNGAWFCTCDTKGIYYLALADSDYPERHAYAFIYDNIREINNLKDYQNQTPVMVSNFTRRYSAKLFQKYNDLKQLDKIFEAHDNAKRAELVMIENVKRTVENKDKFIEIEGKSQDVKSLAHDFFLASDELYKQSEAARRRRLFITGGIIGGCLLTVILLFVNG